MTLLRALPGLFFGLLLCCSTGHTASPPGANVSMFSNVDSIQAGHPVLVGVQIKLPEGWETFWRTPGDVGYGIQFSWENSQNLERANLLWPSPQRITSYGFVANIYRNKVIFPVKITVKDAAKTLILALKLDYLLCNPTACVPHKAQLRLVLPPGKATLTPHAALIDQAMATIPVSGNTNSLAIQQLIVTGQNDQTTDLRIDVWSATGFKDPQLFVEGSQNVLFNVPQFTRQNDTNGFFVIQARKNDALESPKSLNDLLANNLQLTLVNQKEAITLSKTIPRVQSKTTITTAHQKIQSTDSEYFLGSMIFFAFLGGLILNLMPCVFPILSIKILTLHSIKNRRMQGLFYTLGVLCSFLVIALLILSLQSLGNIVGWGFQMQSPAFLILLIVLFTLISLNLFGLFDIPFSLNTNLKWQKSHELLYAFGTGVLASVVTTPCSAPFMATAVGVAISQDSWVTLLIFLSLGLGFSLPYLLLCNLPKQWSVLPKPGVWMEKLKQFLGFPMMLSVVWLLWVTSYQMSRDAVAMIWVSLCFLILFFWLLRNIKPGKLRTLFVVITLGLTAYPLYWIHQETVPRLQRVKTWDYNPAQLESLIKQHQKIFVYATAAWCITCKMNEKIAIDTDAVQNVFDQEKISVIKADWTNKNDAILNYLKQFNRAGIPLYIYYPPSGIPMILPQVLTPSTIVNVIKTAS